MMNASPLGLNQKIEYSPVIMIQCHTSMFNSKEGALDKAEGPVALEALVSLASRNTQKSVKQCHTSLFNSKEGALDIAEVPLVALEAPEALK